MRRAGLILLTALATLGVVRPGLAPAPRLIWNASASVPIGLYAISAGDHYAVGNLVAVRVQEPLAGILAERGYLGRSVPLMKRVLALPGQTVCRTGLIIAVDGTDVGSALPRDRGGRELPVWRGCRRIAGDQLFLMNWQVGDSFDGRYFGPVPRAQLLGRATPLWTDEDGEGRFEWRAPTQMSLPQR